MRDRQAEMIICDIRLKWFDFVTGNTPGESTRVYLGLRQREAFMVLAPCSMTKVPQAPDRFMDTPIIWVHEDDYCRIV